MIALYISTAIYTEFSSPQNQTLKTQHARKCTFWHFFFEKFSEEAAPDTPRMDKLTLMERSLQAPSQLLQENIHLLKNLVATMESKFKIFIHLFISFLPSTIYTHFFTS